MALSALIDNYETVEESHKTFDHRLQKLIHDKNWRDHVFMHIRTNKFHDYQWDKEFDQDFPVFVCHPNVTSCVATKRITLNTLYTGGVAVRHYLVRKVFPFSRNHPPEYYLVPEKVFCDGHWVLLVLPLPICVTRYIEKLSDHNQSKVFVSTSQDIELDQSGKVYQLKAFMDLAREDTEDDQGFKMAIHAIEESFDIAKERFKCYNNEICSVDDGPETMEARIKGEVGGKAAPIGLSVSFFDQIETTVTRTYSGTKKVVVESTLVASWYHHIEGCDLP